MPVESGDYLDSLDASQPPATEAASLGDDYIRDLKRRLNNTLGTLAGALTATHTELNYCAGVTSAIQTQLDAKLATANLLAQLLTVDGAGSGIDADLLDGAQGAAYAKLASADFTALQVGGADVATETYADAAATAAAASASGWLDVLDPIASGSAISSSGNIAHGRGQVPDNVILRLVCKGASGGYSANDIVMLQTSDASNVATEVNATHLIARMWNLMYIPYGDGTNNLFDCRSDNTNWKLQAKAVVY